MATTYIAPTVKQFVDGAMVAFFDASATSAIEAAFVSSGQQLLSPVNSNTIVFLGEAFSTSSIITGNIQTDLQKAAVNLTDSPITVTGELNVFLQAYQSALNAGFTSAQAEGIVIAEFVASTLGAQGANLGLTPSDLAAFQTQQAAATNRATVSGNYADSATPGSTLVPVTIGDAAWVASQNALNGVTSDPTTVTTQEAKITASEAVTPNNPALITPLPLPGQTFTLTTGVDTVPPAGTTLGNNNTVNGIGGGPTGAAVGSTFTPNDSINFGTTTGNVFNLQGIGPAGTWNVTSVPGAHVAGIQTVNIASNTLFGALSSQSVTGNFTATGPEGDWTGLTLLAVSSGSGILGGVDNLTVDPTTAVQVTDSLLGPTATPMTINGGSTVTITENNSLGFGNAGINVNGGTGTTHVSITQTELIPGFDGPVHIVDANGASTTAAGTITTIVLDGLSNTVPATFTSPAPGLALTGTILNTIVDNALTTLTVNNSDVLGAALSITDNLTTPTATTLTLNLSHDGVDATGFSPVAAIFPSLIINDVKNEITTIHLSLGAQNSFLNLVDNGLLTLDTPTAGTGALVGDVFGGVASTITDSGPGAATFDFSGLNGPNNIDVTRVSGVNNDVFTLGNFGTNSNLLLGNTFTTAQHLVIENANINNTDTINFGSGAYDITDALHSTVNPHSYVNTAPDGAGLAAGFPAAEQWAEIANANSAVLPARADTLTFKGDTVQNSFNAGLVGSIAAGIADGLANPAHSATAFHLGGNTFVFDHAGTSAINVSPTDSLVEFVGIVFNNTTTAPGGIIHL